MNSEVEALRRRCAYLEGQVIALSRTPAILSAVIRELQAEVSALRVGAKRRFTEKELRARGDWNTADRAEAGKESLVDVLEDVGEVS